MPAVALIGAVASVSAGVAAGGLLGGMMIAGGVMTGLGTLTGNKKLTRIGAVLGLAGGIGSMISNASSAASTAASVGGEGVSMGSAAGNAGSNAAEFGMAELGNVADTAGVVVNPIAPSGIVAQEIGAPMGNGAFLGETADLAAAGQPGSASQTAALSPQTAAAREAIGQQSAAVGQTGPTINGAQTVAASNPLGEAASKLQGWGKDAFGFVTDPKNANLVKAGSGRVQGAMGAYSRQAELDAQLAQREAQRQRFNRSIIGQYVTR